MASKSSRNETKFARRPSDRPTITLELVAAHAPTAMQADKIAAAFGLDPVDYAAICEAVEEAVARAAQALQPVLHDSALKIHLQRVVASYVGSAYVATQFYGTKVTQARDLTSSLANEDRDEDREGIYGFESKAARARRFAAEAGLAAFALMAAAGGAASAYAHIVGEDWKPYERDSGSSVGRQSAAAELDALG